MGLFSKKPIQTSSTSPLYTLGSQKSLLIVGLGNPGKEYVGTRHNIGFACIEAFTKDNEQFANWVTKKELKCEIASGVFGGVRILAVKPTTFMNLSGEAVQQVQNFYKLPSSETVVLHDELDLEFGQIRTKVGGGSAGHNGLKSIIKNSSDDFGRIRIGINNNHRTKNDEKDFVLKPFSKDEQDNLKNLYKEINSILTETIYSGKLTTETRSFII